MNRRELLVGAGAASTALLASRAAAIADESAAPPPLAAAAHEAYIYTLPLIESATARAGLLAAEPGRVPGAMYFMQAPTTPATQRITTPNNDTINGRGWFDLAHGPVRFRWPATGKRYLSVALLDMYSNNFAVLGSRTTGPDGGAVTIVGPDAAVPPGAVRSPTRWMWILTRVLTAGGDDIAAARAVQGAMRVEAPPMRAPLPPFARRDAAWDDYFRSAGRLFAENPGTPQDEAVRRRIAPLRLDRFDPAAFDAAGRRQIAAGVASARALLRRQSVRGPIVDGWMYPRWTLGDFRQDYLYRAQTALNGFAALPTDEAMYLFATGPRGDLKLDSARRWRLTIPADRVPADGAFWSLVMYRATTDGQFFLFDNPLQRYSVGDRTPGLRRARDGSITIAMQRDPPPDDTPLNWLPTPRDAPFGTVFRSYLPPAGVVTGDWRLPSIVAA